MLSRQTPESPRRVIDSDAAKWAAVQRRDRALDGSFYYSVRTTGVYCKSSCGARPARDNVAFYASCADAERAGYRPCKRCRPNVAVPEIEYTICESTLGPVAIAATDKGICAILFGRHADELRDDLQARFPKPKLTEGGESLAMADILAFIEDPRRTPRFALDPAGTEFQRKVWRALRGIPAGSTASYADIAKKIGEPKASRAVAQVCAANPIAIAIAIPCHRVVRSDGSLSGYRWGAERKRALLAREASA